MWTSENIIVIIVTFILAGFVKGVTGMGLPTVALALLTALLGFKQALVLMLAPALVTNLWQAFVGNAFAEILRRLWPLFLAGSLATLVGTHFAALINTNTLLFLLGLVLCLYSAFGLTAPQIDLSKSGKRWQSAVIGAITGTLTGLTGTYIIPAIPYFQALGMPRNMLVQAMGLWFLVATLSLSLGLSKNGFMSNDLALTSCAAIAPALLGMWLGQQVREKLPEQKFRMVFFFTLFVLGIYIAARAFIS